MTKLIVTIDGPGAAGKGTVAFLLSKRYGLVDIDSGALFRAITWLALKHELPLDAGHGQTIANLARKHHIRLAQAELGGPMRMGVTVDNEDVSKAIRTESLSRAVPAISALPEVREVVSEMQHAMVEESEKGVIIEGRDTGTVIFPQAQIKVFLTASAEERAGRRHAELIERGQQVSFEEIYSDLAARDLADVERTLSPLTKPDDAILIDSTGKTIEWVLDKVGGLIDDYEQSAY